MLGAREDGDMGRSRVKPLEVMQDNAAAVQDGGAIEEEDIRVTDIDASPESESAEAARAAGILTLHGAVADGAVDEMCPAALDVHGPASRCPALEGLEGLEKAGCGTTALKGAVGEPSSWCAAVRRDEVWRRHTE